MPSFLEAPVNVTFRTIGRRYAGCQISQYQTKVNRSSLSAKPYRADLVKHRLWFWLEAGNLRGLQASISVYIPPEIKCYF
ncbi:hypothetical protein SAMN05421739_103508 [Pontibacter chinhatensis]|uniref:Uncharacterized protein n=1 Tax=Pontibacter chinhatensis TaxID=1436961 RepID=A0A1I2UDY8_9BACT|nr:hypothetical protein SAMN05421739_103508 [Pontibacter chinhatensis]